MDRKDEICRLQRQIIDELGKSMKRVGEDLWGARTDPFASFPAPPKAPSLEDAQAVAGDSTHLSPSLSDFCANSGAKGSDTGAPEAKENAAEQKEETKEEEQPAETIEDLEAELNGYIGLDTVKAQVKSLINWITVNKKREEMGLSTPDLSLHMVFSGNPGTGKTMVARLMSRVFKALGILSKGHLVEVDRSGLVAGYVGQTAIKTQEVCSKAKGGVLFIDEAYSLTDRGENDFGQEAVDTVLKAMEDNRDDMVVIVAGYIELMQGFIHSNPGLASRFNRYIDFPDYTVDEMMGIFDMRCGKGYRLAEDARETLKDLITDKSRCVKEFGNARGVRNLFELAIAAQADRLASLGSDTEWTEELLMTLTRADIEKAVGIESEDAELPEEKPVCEAETAGNTAEEQQC